MFADADGTCIMPVADTKSIVDEDVDLLSQQLGELWVTGCVAGVVPQVLQQQDLHSRMYDVITLYISTACKAMPCLTIAT